MVNVAVLGYGVVGSGVAEIIKKNSASISHRAGDGIRLKKILDICDFPESPDKDLLTKNQDDVFKDESISIVIETIGGTGVAYEFTKKAFKAGKHVVTSNKELVAAYGPELLKSAADSNVNYLFEASVGGGIPIIRPLNQCLAANEIIGITGILNGTTNYILTRMKRDGMDFSEALKSAQQNGYAEADPAADIEGHDACRKIAILSSIAYNEFIDFKSIRTEGIAGITSADIEYAESLNSIIKLIAISKRVDGKIYARVGPVIIGKTHPLANVEDEFNAIIVKGDAIGDAMFYGRGAGKLPTASAVVADIIDIVKHIDSNGRTVWERKEYDNLMNVDNCEARYFIRVKARNRDEAQSLVSDRFGKVKFITIDNPGLEDEFAFITIEAKEYELKNCIRSLTDNSSIRKVVNIIRFGE